MLSSSKWSLSIKGFTITSFAALTLCSPELALAADGILKFEGTIQSGTCRINGSSGESTYAVDFGTIKPSAFTINGQPAIGGEPRPITLNLTNCPAEVDNAGVYIMFDDSNPQIDRQWGGLTSKTGPGFAKNVQAHIYETDDSGAMLPNAIPLGGPRNAPRKFKITSGSATMKYFSQLIRRDQSPDGKNGVTPGLYSSVMRFWLNYE